jgi:Fe-S cluster assembly ATP-binding protein
MDAAYANRYLNVGFSGGEKKKTEILQMLTLQPKVSHAGRNRFRSGRGRGESGLGRHQKFKNGDNALLIITHNAKILEDLKVDFVHVLAGGKIIKTGGPELIDEIGKYGFHSLEAGEARE